LRRPRAFSYLGQKTKATAVANTLPAPPAEPPGEPIPELSIDLLLERSEAVRPIPEAPLARTLRRTGRLIGDTVAALLHVTSIAVETAGAVSARIASRALVGLRAGRALVARAIARTATGATSAARWGKRFAPKLLSALLTLWTATVRAVVWAGFALSDAGRAMSDAGRAMAVAARRAATEVAARHNARLARASAARPQGATTTPPAMLSLAARTAERPPAPARVWVLHVARLSRRTGALTVAAALILLAAGAGLGTYLTNRRAPAALGTLAMREVQPVASAASPDVARALTTTKSAVDGSSAKPSRPLTKKRTPADEHAPAAVRDVTREEGTENRRGGLLGTLVVASQPRGARVTVDGIPRGKAPVSIARLRAGNRLVRLEMDGYQRWAWSVYISPDRPTRLNVDLVPNRNPPAPSGPRASLGGR
jgi:hypothetical protein